MRNVTEQTVRQGPGIGEGVPCVLCKGRVRCTLETLRELLENFYYNSDPMRFAC